GLVRSRPGSFALPARRCVPELRWHGFAATAGGSTGAPGDRGADVAGDAGLQARVSFRRGRARGAALPGEDTAKPGAPYRAEQTPSRRDRPATGPLAAARRGEACRQRARRPGQAATPAHG